MNVDWVISVQARLWPDEDEQGEPLRFEQRWMLDTLDHDALVTNPVSNARQVHEFERVLALVVKPMIHNIKTAIGPQA